MLRKRIVSAFILLVGTFTFIALDIWANNFGCSGFWLLPLAFYLIAGSAYECANMLRDKIGAIVAPALAATLAVMIAACVPMLWPICGSSYPKDCHLGRLGWPLVTAAVAQLSCFVYYFQGFAPQSGVFYRAVLAGWIASYFGVGFAFAVGLRMIEPAGYGLYLLIGVILVTKSADTGAYFAGRFLGRSKLCPAVSPNKTVEGLVGGTLVATLAAWLYFQHLGTTLFEGHVQVTWIGVVSFGVVLTLAGLVGDLLESTFKREVGYKDSGTLLPGLGGLWDVTDSLLPAFACGYLLTQTGWIRFNG